MAKGNKKPGKTGSKSDSVIEEKTETQESDAEPSKSSTVQDLINKVKNDPQLTDPAKLDTLSLLVMTFLNENSAVQNEIIMVNEQTKKHIEAKNAIQALNEFLKKQISLIKEESELRLKEEKNKRGEGIGGYHDTMTELSSVLETQQGNNSSLKVQNGELADQMLDLVKETGERAGQIEKMQMEYELQITVLEHQVAKAKIEKAEVQANMAKERLEIMQQLAAERNTGLKLNDSVKLLKHQADLYQGEMVDLQKDGVDNSKSFQFFKTQIEKLTGQMVQLEQQTDEWREKSEISTGQVKKMNESTNDRDKELTQLRKKLESMDKLNKALNAERVTLLEKVENQGI